MNNKAIGNRIKRIRQELGLTQKEFGELVDNADSSLVSKWERGMSLPNKKRQTIIAELGGVDLSVILRGTKDEVQSNKTFDESKYYDYLEKKLNELIESYAKQYGNPYVSKFKEIDIEPLKSQLKELIEHSPDILLTDYDDVPFNGNLEIIDDSETFLDEYIYSEIESMIYRKLNEVKNSIPKSDEEVLNNLKQDIIKLEKNIKSLYLDDSSNEYDNNGLNIEMYKNISNVLKDTIFNLVRLEEYI